MVLAVPGLIKPVIASLSDDGEVVPAELHQEQLRIGGETLLQVEPGPRDGLGARALEALHVVLRLAVGIERDDELRNQLAIAHAGLGTDLRMVDALGLMR